MNLSAFNDLKSLAVKQTLNMTSYEIMQYAVHQSNYIAFKLH